LSALHDHQAIRCVRGEARFALHLRNGRRVTWVAADPSSGPARGYAVSSEDGKQVTEIVAADALAARALASHLVRCSAGESVEFQCNVQPGEAGRVLHAIAEHRSLTTNGNWLIFDWPKVVGALLRAHHQNCPLPRGSVILGIEGQRSMEMRVDASGAGCQWTNHPPDFAADPLTIVRALFGPANPAQVMDLNAGASLLRAWCPLPAGFSAQDYV
jgi:hypothetical protein